MRVITYNNAEYSLSERSYKQLMGRFDPSRVKLNIFGQYFIPVKSICWNRPYKCLKCPLRSPQKRNVSCTYLFTRIMGEDLSKYVYMFDVGIFWDVAYDTLARQALERVRKVLNSARQTKYERVSR